MVTQTPTRHTTTWTDSCTRCQAMIVALHPGDIKLAQQRQGWQQGHCPRCVRGARQ